MRDPDLVAIFTHHPPRPSQVKRYESLRAKGREMAELIWDCAPSNAERTLAIRSVQQAVMWANASIAIGEAWMDKQPVEKDLEEGGGDAVAPGGDRDD